MLPFFPPRGLGAPMQKKLWSKTHNRHSNPQQVPMADSTYSSKSLIMAGILPLILGAMMIASGAVTVHYDKDLTKPVVAFQAVILAFGALAVLLAVILMGMGGAKKTASVSILGGRNALGARRSWYPDTM
jgi:uncharacterized membrane protein